MPTLGSYCGKAWNANGFLRTQDNGSSCLPGTATATLPRILSNGQEKMIMTADRHITMVLAALLGILLGAWLCGAADSGKNAQESYARAWKLLCDGKQKEAESLLSELATEHPKDQKIAFLRAACSRSRFNITGSAQLFRLARAIDAKSAEGQCAGLVTALDSREDIDKNLEAFRTLLKNNPDNMPILWMFAVQCRSNSLGEEGVDSYARLLKNMGKGPVLVHQSYGTLLDDFLNRYDEALKHRLLAVELEPASWSYRSLAGTLHKLKRFKEADEAFRKTVEFDPQDANHWISWGSCLRDEGKMAEATEKFEHALKLSPGNGCAWSALASDYANEKKFKEAIRCYRRAASLGCVHAPYSLGLAYQKGVGVSNDTATAVEWFQKGAEDNEPYAAWALADCYLNGRGVKKDAGKAIPLLELSASQGHREALTTLGQCYFQGTGVTRDVKKAVSCYERAASNGYPYAYCMLGEVFEFGNGVQRNPSEAEKWFLKGVALDDAYAMYHLGKLYDYSFTNDGHLEEAMKWYRKSAATRNPYALHNIANMYLEGRGVKANETEAFKWFKESADAGLARSMGYIGYAYLHGKGVAKDRGKGLSYLMKGAEGNDSISYYHLGSAYQLGWDVEEAPAKAIDFHSKGAELGNGGCLLQVAWMYATVADNSLRNADKAMEISNRVLAQSPDDWGYRNILAAAYAAAGHFDKAADTQEKSLKIMRDSRCKADDIKSAEERLKLYREKKPYQTKPPPAPGETLE
ncbi:MAG: hypothetical protein C0404_11840 [Verrucomicrobia bacterium]|nr:hypothetical protein [Verrucomicrobiota bacterium]